MGDPAIMTTLLFVVAAAVTGGLARAARRKEALDVQTREWIEYLQQDILV